MAKNSLKILVAPNGFKESLSATAAAQAIAKGVRAVYPHAQIILAPLADGGSGTVTAIATAAQGEIVRARVHNPRGKKILAHYAILPDKKTAIIEMAAASGLALLATNERNPLLTSSYGSGELIRHACARGVKKIVIGIGDSATVDGGIGALQALGVRILNRHGRPVAAGGRALKHIHSIDARAAQVLLNGVEIIIATDVDNPLLGARGAAPVFGPQKGATPAMVTELAAGLNIWATVLTRATGCRVKSLAGGGAAGGFASGFCALFNAQLISGSALVFDYCRLAEKIPQADLIFTGEGAIDEQTLRGKTPLRLAAAARAAKVPLIAFAARIAVTEKRLRAQGFSAAVPIIDAVTTLAEARKNGAQLLTGATIRTLRMLALGAQLPLPA